jgi:hypothetical protein
MVDAGRLDCRAPELTAALNPLLKKLDALNRNEPILTHTSHRPSFTLQFERTP